MTLKALPKGIQGDPHLDQSGIDEPSLQYEEIEVSLVAGIVRN
jgi:hypothetical protein